MPDRLFKLHEKKLPGLAAEYLSVTGPPLSCEPHVCNQRKQKAVAILAGGISFERPRHDGNRDGTGRRVVTHLASPSAIVRPGRLA